MSKKAVFVSFDYDDDRDYKNILKAWDSNKSFDFMFRDVSSGEIKSNEISRVKAALTRKINNAKYTLVIIGKNANKIHKDHEQIGFTNWINFEINQSKLNNNKLIAVKLDKNYESPDELLGAGASWAMSFTQKSIINALENV